MRVIVLSAAFGVLCLTGWAADDVNPAEIIQKFAAKELEFQQARNNYTYRQSVKMEEVNGGGKWEEVDDIIFTPEGKRIEKVVYAPVISLRQISLSPEDVQDLRNVQPFVLTTPEIPSYDIQYLGQGEGGRHRLLHLLGEAQEDASPASGTSKGRSGWTTRICRSSKTYGKGVGIVKGDQAFPKFETYREQIDKKYWFPTYTRATDTLHFKSGENVPIRMTVKYQDYKKYEGRSTIKFGDVVDDDKGRSAFYASHCPAGYEEKVIAVG